MTGTIYNALGIHTAIIKVNGLLYIGQGFTNNEALENCFDNINGQGRQTLPPS